MKIDSFKDFKYISNIDQNENFVVYHITTVNMKENIYEKNIYLYDKKLKKQIQLTNSGKDGYFTFFKDGSIVFSSSRNVDSKKKEKLPKELEEIIYGDSKKEEKEIKSRLYKINPNGGEAVEFLKSEHSIGKFYELNDNKIIYTNNISAEKLDYQDITKLPFWFNGAGYIYGNKTDLHILDENGNDKKINSDEIEISDFVLNKNKTYAVVIYSNNTDVMELTNYIGILDLSTLKIKEISKGKVHYYADFIKDGIISIATDMKKTGLNEDAKVFYFDIDGKNEKQISSDNIDIAFFNSVGTDARQGEGNAVQIVDDKMCYISTYFDNAVLSSIDLDGNIEEVISRNGSVEGFTYDGNDFYFTAMRDLQLPELYKLENNQEIKLTDFSKDLEAVNLSKIEEFNFENDGNKFVGYVIKPVGYEKGKKYPGILQIHGGPKTAYSTVLHHEMQFLANQGYFVFYTNPRGSSGRGDDFSDIRGKYGTIDFDDLMKFTDEVLEKYSDIDQLRLAVMGGSYGGFMTNWIIGHTDRFKVANSQRSISNWTSFYGVSDIGYCFVDDQTQANPLDNLEKVWEQSPLKYAKNVKTPTLFIHASEDYRCPLEQGVQMYASLKMNNVDTKLVIFEGENHDLSRTGKPQARLKRLYEIQKWFEKYLK